MLNKALACAGCDSTCYQICTGCTADCSSNCSSSCTGTCSTGCSSSCTGCTGNCISACTGSCSNTCTSEDTSSTITVNYFTLSTSYYSYAHQRPKIVRVTDAIFLMFLGYSSSDSSVQAVAFKVTDDNSIIYGTQAIVTMSVYYNDVISTYEIDGCDCKQVVVVSGYNSSTITLFTINIADDLTLTVGTASNINAASTPTIQYKQYATGFTPDATYNFIKLINTTSGLYFTSISSAKQASIHVGDFSSTGIKLVDTIDTSLAFADPNDAPELFFNSSYTTNRVGVFSINNFFECAGNYCIMSTSNYESSGTNFQSHASFIEFNPASASIAMRIRFVINSETPSMSNLLHLTGNFYVLVDELYSRNSRVVSANNILRVTPYELRDGVFTQCGSAIVWRGLLSGTTQTNYSALMSCTSVAIQEADDKFTILVCASFADNIKHTAGKRYLCAFTCKVYNTLHNVLIDNVDNYTAGNGEQDTSDIIGGVNNATYPLNMDYIRTPNGGNYVILTDSGASKNDVATITIIKLSPYINGRVMASYKVYFDTLGNLTFHTKNLIKDLGNCKYVLLLQRFGSVSYGYTTEVIEMGLDLSPCDEDYKNSPKTWFKNNTELATNTVEGVTAGNIGSNNLTLSRYFIPEIFYDDIVCTVYSTKIITYRWDVSDGKFYMLDTYTTNVSVPSSNMYYYRDRWCRKYSDSELLVLDPSTKYYELLHINPNGKISQLTYETVAKKSSSKVFCSNILTPYTMSIFKDATNDELYILNPTPTTALALPNTANMALLPLHIEPSFKTLDSYIIGNSGQNPFGMTIDDSTDGQPCKTMIPDIK